MKDMNLIVDALSSCAIDGNEWAISILKLRDSNPNKFIEELNKLSEIDLLINANDHLRAELTDVKTAAESDFLYRECVAMIESMLCNLKPPATCVHWVDGKFARINLCGGNIVLDGVKGCPYRQKIVIEKSEDAERR